MAVTGVGGVSHWFAVWTHSRCEQLVHDQLVAKDFRTYLPMLQVWSRRAGNQHLIDRPMFPGYLFVNHPIDKYSHVEVLKSRGVVRILGGRWDRLVPVPDVEVESLQRLQHSGVAVQPYSHLREGQRVRIDAGPLAGLEGILVRIKPQRGLLVLSVDLLRQSVAVEVDCTVVTPIGYPSSLPLNAPSALTSGAECL